MPWRTRNIPEKRGDSAGFSLSGKQCIVIGGGFAVFSVLLLTWVSSRDLQTTGNQELQSPVAEFSGLEPKVGRQNAKSADLTVAAEQRERIIAQFDEKLLTYRNLLKMTKVAEDALGDKASLAYAADGVGQTELGSVLARYKEFPTRPEEAEFARLHSEQMKQLKSKQNDLMFGPICLDLLGSQQRVGEATVGSIVQELFEQTEFADVFKSRLLNTCNKYFPGSPAAEALRAASEPSQILAAVDSLAPLFQQEYQRAAAALFASRPIWNEYYSDLMRATILRHLMVAYKTSWTVEFDQARARGSEARRQAMQLMLDMPDENDRIRMAGAILDADKTYAQLSGNADEKGEHFGVRVRVRVQLLTEGEKASEASRGQQLRANLINFSGVRIYWHRVEQLLSGLARRIALPSGHRLRGEG